MKRRPFLMGLASLAALPGGAAATMQVGSSVPDFTRADLQGRPVRLSSHRGKLVLLNFWATWCPPCREELPVFSRWQASLRARGLQVIGVSMDDARSEVERFLAQYPVEYPIVMGDARFAEQFGGVLGLPLTYLIDAQGKVVARYQGEVDLAKMETKVKELLGAR